MYSHVPKDDCINGRQMIFSLNNWYFLCNNHPCGKIFLFVACLTNFILTVYSYWTYVYIYMYPLAHVVHKCERKRWSNVGTGSNHVQYIYIDIYTTYIRDCIILDSLDFGVVELHIQSFCFICWPDVLHRLLPWHSIIIPINVTIRNQSLCKQNLSQSRKFCSCLHDCSVWHTHVFAL